MKRVLFVDDEQNVLAGLANMLRRHRREWDMVFLPGGEAALDDLGKTEADVLVTDMRMPYMDGATLLRHVHERHPGVVRIVLSGQAELEAGLRALPFAHQFLAKPCDAATLYETVSRACALRDMLSSAEFRGHIGRLRSLPARPQTFAALSAVLASPDASGADAARVVEQDVGVAVKLLQVVNSAFFSLPRKLSSIREVVAYLGTNLLKSIVLSTEILHCFPGLPGELSLDEFHHHALVTARVACVVLPDPAYREDVLTAAMLHDVGRLVLAAELPERYARLAADAARERRRLDDAEAREFGVGHAEVGAYLLGVWGLPYPIVEAVAFHHRPSRTQSKRLDVTGAVHLGGVLAEASQVGGHASLEHDTELDMDYVSSVSIEGRLDEWRAAAAKLLASGGGNQ